MTEIVMYRAEGNRVVSSMGRPLSIAKAAAMRTFYLEDIAKQEADLGSSDPDLADIMIAHNLRCARQLREAIKAASAAPSPSEPILERAAA